MSLLNKTLYSPSKMFTDEEYAQLLKHSIGKKRILEFGPGTSTYAFIEAGCMDIHTCEYAEKWLQITDSRFRKFPQVKIHAFQNVPEIVIHDLYGRFDLAFVDSPKGIKDGPSRLNTLRFAFERTDQVILHDANRVHEQQSIEIISQKVRQGAYLTTNGPQLSIERLTPKLWLLTK